MGSVVRLPKVEKSTSQSLKESVASRGRDWVLYQGDSLELMKQFDDATFDMVFADPPYFLSNGGFTCSGGKRAKVDKGQWDVSQGHNDDYDFTKAWLAECQRVLKPSGTIWVSGTQHVIFSVGYAMQSLGYKLLNTVTWFKPNASPNLSCRYFTHSTELLIWAAPTQQKKLGHTFNYSAMKEANGGKQMRDVWALPPKGDAELDDKGDGRLWVELTPRNSEKSFGKHPTQKPLALLERVVEAATVEDAVILDPFCGSATTGVAAVSNSRRFVGIELDSNYLSLAQKRLEAAKRP